MGYREQLNECTDPASGDWFELTDTSAGSTDKDRKVNVGRFAILANANTFAVTGTSTVPVTVNMPASTTAVAQRWQYNGTTRAQVNATSSSTHVALAGFDNGSGLGPSFIADRNSNASTPAAGNLRLTTRGAADYYVWPDNSGNLRIGTTGPTNAQDTSGTIVGGQTSYIETKEDIVPWDGAGALDEVLALNLFRYKLKTDDTKRQYCGIIIADNDRGDWFSENDAENQTPVLNERNLFGYLIASIHALQSQVDALKQRLGE